MGYYQLISTMTAYSRLARYFGLVASGAIHFASFDREPEANL